MPEEAQPGAFERLQSGLPFASEAVMTSPTRQPLDARAVLLMLTLCLIWGAQQVVMKSIAADITPLTQLAVRFTGAALVFGILVLRQEGMRGFTDGDRKSTRLNSSHT